MDSDELTHRYYRTLGGRWSGAYGFAITSWAAFRACRMGALDRQRLASMSIMTSLLGSLRMSTTVDYASQGARGEVRHTTRVTKAGMTFFRSVEPIILNADGRTLIMRGKQHFFPTLWIGRDFGEATGEVNGDATGVTYRIPWIGGELLQRARIVDNDGVELTQETPWSRAEVTLRRVGPSQDQ